MKHELFSAFLRKLILTCGLSRYEIARQSGVTEASLSRFVNGRTGLTTACIDKLAPVIGLKVSSVKILLED